MTTYIRWGADSQILHFVSQITYAATIDSTRPVPTTIRSNSDGSRLCIIENYKYHGIYLIYLIGLHCGAPRELGSPSFFPEFGVRVQNPEAALDTTLHILHSR